jgi:hypothetical protein
MMKFLLCYKVELTRTRELKKHSNESFATSEQIESLSLNPHPSPKNQKEKN